MVFMRLEKYILDGTVISRNQFHYIKVQAFVNANTLMEKKIVERAKLPTHHINGKRIKRKRLEFPNIRHILKDLVMNHKDERI